MSFVDFMTNYGEYIAFAVYALVSIVLFFRTKDIKYLKELNEAMKYRTAAYRETENRIAGVRQPVHDGLRHPRKPCGGTD